MLTLPSANPENTSLPCVYRNIQVPFIYRIKALDHEGLIASGHEMTDVQWFGSGSK